MARHKQTPDEVVQESIDAASAEAQRVADAVPESERIGETQPAERMAQARGSRTPVDKNESKRDRFYRLAVKRIPKALKALAAIGALANTSQYERTEEWESKILSTIDAAHKAMVQKFRGGKVFDEGFKL